MQLSKKRPNEDAAEENKDQCSKKRKLTRTKNGGGQWNQEHDTIVDALVHHLGNIASLAEIVFEYGANFEMVSVGCPSAFYNPETRRWQFNRGLDTVYDEGREMFCSVLVDDDFDTYMQCHPEIQPWPLVRHDYVWEERRQQQQQKPIRRVWYQDARSDDYSNNQRDTLVVPLDLVYDVDASVPDPKDEDTKAMDDLRLVMTWFMAGRDWSLPRLDQMKRTRCYVVSGNRFGQPISLSSFVTLLRQCRMPREFGHVIDSGPKHPGWKRDLCFGDYLDGWGRQTTMHTTTGVAFSKQCWNLARVRDEHDRRRLLNEMPCITKVQGEEALFHHADNVRYLASELDVPVPEWFQHKYGVWFHEPRQTLWKKFS